MATFTYEVTELRYNPYTKNIEPVGVTQADLDGITAQIDINTESIALKVSSDEILSQINLSSEGILISGDRILLDGDVTVDGSFSITSISDASVLSTKDYINTNDLISTTNPANGVVFDSNGIRGYNSSDKKFEINTNGDAYFKGTINNIDDISGKKVTLDTGELLFEDAGSTRKILYDEIGIRSYVGTDQTMNISNDYTIGAERIHIDLSYTGNLVGTITTNTTGIYLNGVSKIYGDDAESGEDPMIAFYNYNTSGGSGSTTSGMRLHGANLSNILHITNESSGGSSSTGASLFIDSGSSNNGQAIKVTYRGTGRGVFMESTNGSAAGFVRYESNGFTPTLTLKNNGSGFDLSGAGSYGINANRIYVNSSDTGNYYISRVGEDLYWTNSGGSTKLN